jgi:hypothetical protein
MKVQTLLPKGSSSEHMRPERSIERTPHIIRPESILTARQSVFDFGICERHGRMAAEQEALVTLPRFMETMTPFVQAKRLQQIARKAGDGVGVEFARYPEMFIEN